MYPCFVLSIFQFFDLSISAFFCLLILFQIYHCLLLNFCFCVKPYFYIFLLLLIFLCFHHNNYPSLHSTKKLLLFRKTLNLTSNTMSQNNDKFSFNPSIDIPSRKSVSERRSESGRRGVGLIGLRVPSKTNDSFRVYVIMFM